MLVLQCPKCGHRVEVASSLAGLQLSCPACHALLPTGPVTATAVAGAPAPGAGRDVSPTRKEGAPLPPEPDPPTVTSSQLPTGVSPPAGPYSFLSPPRQA